MKKNKYKKIKRKVQQSFLNYRVFKAWQHLEKKVQSKKSYKFIKTKT